MKHFKKFGKRIVAVFLAVVIVCSVVFSDYEDVNATGLDPISYFTYWDLIYSLGYATGYDITYRNMDFSADIGSRKSGKEVWEEFCDSFYETLVSGGQYTGDLLDPLLDKLKVLPEIATASGLVVAQDLWDALKDYFACEVQEAVSVNVDDYAPISEALPYRYVYSITNFYAGTYYVGYASSSSALQLVYTFYKNTFNAYAISSFPFSLSYYSSNENYTWNNTIENLRVHLRNGYYYCSVYAAGNTESFSFPGKEVSDILSYIDSLPVGAAVDINAPVIDVSNSAESACPEEVPEVIPWETHPAIPDGWRVVYPQEDPDPEKKPDLVPGLVPISPDIISPEDPDSTEDPGSSEDPDENKDPATLPEGWENWAIDPDTGFLINPQTGLLIDPATGQVIDPETGESVDPSNSPGLIGDVGGSIKELFPFCIPFDIIKLIKGMQADKAPPVFHFEYYFDSIDYTFTIDVDLSDYDKYIQIFRFGMEVFWVLALMFLTVKVSALFV